MPSIASLSVRLLYEHLHDHGIDPQALLGEPWPAPNDMGEARTSPAQWMAMMEKAAEATGEAAFGVQVARRFDWNHLGLLGYLLRSSGSLLEALSRGERFHGIVSEFNPLKAQITGSEIVLSWPLVHGSAGQLWEEFGLTCTVRLLQLLTGENEKPSRTEFCGPTPPDLTPYHEFFGPNVLFDRPMPVLAGPISRLATPLPAGDAGLLQMLEREAEELLLRLAPRHTELQEMRSILLQLLPQQKASLQQLATRLHCSERTLQRRLAAHGVRFADLLAELRQEAARDYLNRSRYSLADVACLLGYADQSTFTRAFRDWFGTTPLVWRRNAMA